MQRSHRSPVSVLQAGLPQLQRLWTVALFCALTVLSCAPQDSSPAESSDLELSLSPSNPQIAQGTALYFEVHALQPSGHRRNVTQEARVSVLSVSQRPMEMSNEGLLQVEEPGRYQVRAEYGGQMIETFLTVTTATLTSLAIGPSAPQVPKGLPQAFTAIATFSDGTTQDVTKMAAWSVKDIKGSGVAIITGTGVATTANVGQARVSVRYQTQGASTTLDVTAAAVTKLGVSPSNPSLAKGTSQAFTAKATFTDATVQDVTAVARWTVTDVAGSGVASIDSLGMAIAKSVGQATVSAAYQGQSTQTTMRVTEAAVASLVVSPATATLPQRTTRAFKATATMTDGTQQDVTTEGAWTATDVAGTAVASVDNKGVVKGNTAGTASIACTYKGHSGVSTLTVTPVVPVSIKVQPPSATIAKGLMQKFTLVATYSDASVQDVSTLAVWKIQDISGTNIASVDTTGLAVGKDPGKAKLTATYMGKNASGTLTVGAATAIAVMVSPKDAVLKPGATQQYNAMANMSDGSQQDVTLLADWFMTDISPAIGVASIGTNGLASGTNLGQAEITAEYMGQSESTKLTVCNLTTCAEKGANCGSISDGCGNTLNCGTCGRYWDTCGGGGTPNVCGCPSRRTCADFRLYNCGSGCGRCFGADDGCGGQLSCCSL